MTVATGLDLPPSGLVARRCQGALRQWGNSKQFQPRNSTATGKVSDMTTKSKRNETLELHARPAQPQAEDAAANHEPNPDEIRRRAYEIYLESGGLPGRELDDWLRAERELRKVALFTQDWNRLQQRHRPDSGGRN